MRSGVRGTEYAMGYENRTLWSRGKRGKSIDIKNLLKDEGLRNGVFAGIAEHYCDRSRKPPEHLMEEIVDKSEGFGGASRLF